MKAIELIRAGLVAMGADGLVNPDTECVCVLANLVMCDFCACQCEPAKIVPCGAGCEWDHPPGQHLVPMGDEL